MSKKFEHFPVLVAAALVLISGCGNKPGSSPSILKESTAIPSVSTIEAPRLTERELLGEWEIVDPANATEGLLTFDQHIDTITLGVSYKTRCDGVLAGRVALESGTLILRDEYEIPANGCDPPIRQKLLILSTIAKQFRSTGVSVTRNSDGTVALNLTGRTPVILRRMKD